MIRCIRSGFAAKKNPISYFSPSPRFTPKLFYSLRQSSIRGLTMPKTSKDYLKLGEKRYARGDFDEAMEWYNKAIEVQPENKAAWSSKALMLAELERFDEAIKCFDEALKIDDMDRTLWYGKAISLSRMGMYDEAIKAYDRVLGISPNHEKAWIGKGLALAELGRWSEALDYANKGIEIHPDFVNAWFLKAIALESFSRYDEAIECYEKMLELDPNNNDAIEGINECKEYISGERSDDSGYI